MGKSSDPDRFLTRRGDVYQYVRRVPLVVAGIDARAPAVRQSLRTDDIALARLKRDALERADDEYWGALLAGASATGAKDRYKAAVLRAEGLGFSYRAVSDLVANASIEELLARFKGIEGVPPASPVSEALLGIVDVPRVTVTESFDIYVSEVMPHELVGKSASQRKDWKKVKQRAVTNFVNLIGDVPISEITREQASRFYRMWMERIAPGEGPPTHSASSGNRDVGNMRQLFRLYHKHIGRPDQQNPFDGFSFSEKKKRSRPPFSVEWLRKWFLHSSRLKGLNDQARGIILMMIETGARPSELANLSEKTIVLSGPVPHIIIEPRDDPDDPREIKTVSSVRKVPLVGVALAVAKRNPSGFPRYWNKERTLSNTLNKSLAEHRLLETEKHKAYSIRHAFENRMKEGQFDEEMRRQLMGHVIDRPKYGSGFSLTQMQSEMKRIALPFDPSIV